MTSVLEIIALDVADARAAAQGGAERLEVVADMAADGLTPTVATIAEIRDAVDLELRVMLRPRDAFDIASAELDQLAEQAAALAAAGADAFVFGYLAGDDLDVAALRQLGREIGRPWTLNRAFDRVGDPERAYAAAATMPGLDRILTSGGLPNATAGWPTLATRGGWQDRGPRWVAGGGMRSDFVAPLVEAGISEFHVGADARVDESWDAPVSAERVAVWRELVDR